MSATASHPGRVVVLNGAPRSGKSSIAAAMAAADVHWSNLGVDTTKAATPERLLPGIGLRPGGERPDLEASIGESYDALFARVAELARQGTPVVADVGLHRHYCSALDPWALLATHLAPLEPLLVGVRCPLDEIMRRRERHADGYLTRMADGSIPAPVQRWQAAVHDPGVYDMEIDTSEGSAHDGATRIMDRLAAGSAPTALTMVAGHR